jgi:hypothetical protein
MIGPTQEVNRNSMIAHTGIKLQVQQTKESLTAIVVPGNNKPQCHQKPIPGAMHCATITSDLEIVCQLTQAPLI